MKACVLLLVTACLALGSSACGGDSDASTDDASADLAAQVDDVCGEWRDALDARGDFPVDDFDPEQPAAEALPAVGEYFASATPATEQALESLRALDATDGLRAELDALAAAFEEQLANAKEQIRAALDADVAGFTATLDSASATSERVDDAADALGAERCAA